MFESKDFGQVRTIVEGDKVLFCGADVAKALWYTNPRKALADHCKGVTKRYGVSRTTNQHGVTTEQTVEMSYIYEGDVYRLIARSKLPSAEKFERWVFDEILPSIRKHGAYLSPDTMKRVMQDPDFIIGLIEAIKTEQAARKVAEAKVELLAAETLTWADRKVLNAIVRRYAARVCGGDFARAWNSFYKELLYKHDISLRGRATSRMNSTGKRVKPFDTLADEELAQAIGTAVAMCHEDDVDTEYPTVLDRESRHSLGVEAVYKDRFQRMRDIGLWRAKISTRSKLSRFALRAVAL